VTKAWPGRPFPLGSTWDGAGTNFALFSEHADGVELCLRDPDGTERRVALTERTAHVWHGYLPDVGPGQRYGYRVHGPWAPEDGHRFNPAKFLLDPYAKAIDGTPDTTDPRVFARGLDGYPDLVDSASAMPSSVVVDPAFDWGDDRPPGVPWHETVIAETHVRGATLRHPWVPPDLRGTYAGLAHPAAVEHFIRLGVTAVELLPVHHIADEPAVLERGAVNYWGYSSIGFFAPDPRYAASGRGGEQVREFREMVRALHAAGIEVILDVVYNHTAEGGVDGPMLAFKGIDNRSYYRLHPDDPSRYVDFTGTGNSLNPVHPSVLRLIMDSLRYWVLEMHVDGFRFDLAAALARELWDVDRLSAFFDTIHQDPVLSQVKLIAEPWDLGEGGYQVGNFPVLWAEWNGKYRDAMRDFWRGAGGGLAEFASRFAGSSDLYQDDGRHPSASVNFITAHDGFTLADLVAYEHKHNEANGEDNRDGTDDNRSWNCGVEGPADDEAVIALRARQQRNLLATLLLSEGVPMISGGDEIGRTQGGNNNAYCQDNEISWYDWGLDQARRELLAFTQRLVALRRDNPVFHRRAFLTGRETMGSGLPDVAWFRPDGRPMAQRNWSDPELRTLVIFLNGEEIPTPTPDGHRIVGDSFLVIVNAAHERALVRLPPRRFGLRWELTVSTSEPQAHDGRLFPARTEVALDPHSMLVVRRAA
jgi:glycogen operon protein